jgi:3-hydroxyacyl-[acyl-carrier-protein] dehydratase
MRFSLVDRILEVEPGHKIRVVKNLTLGEEYLADHFPMFPIMPGVLMLETLVEAAAWLVRITEDFAHSVVVLREAKNVKYGNLMEPGRSLVVTAELAEPLQPSRGGLATFKARGEVDGTATVSARITVARYNLGDRNGALRETDARLIGHLRGLHTLLTGALACKTC